MSGRRALRLSVDHGQKWPLNDNMLAGPSIPWDEIITADLKTRLLDWATFFRTHANEEIGLFGSEERRRWFGDRFDFTIDLWF